MGVNCNCALIHLREIALTLTLSQGERELCKHSLRNYLKRKRAMPTAARKQDAGVWIPAFAGMTVRPLEVLRQFLIVTHPLRGMAANNPSFPRKRESKLSPPFDWTT